MSATTGQLESRPYQMPTVQERAAAVFGAVPDEEKLKELVKKSATITTITNGAGWDQCHAARMDLRNTRLEIARTGEAGREDAVQTSKAIIAIQKRLIAVTSAEEERLAAIEKVWDDRVAAEKEARVQAEIARTANINALIDKIRSWPVSATGKDSKAVDEILQSATDYAITESEFQEKTADAKQALMITVHALQGLLAERLKHEAEQRQLEADRAELAQRRRDDEARRVEAEAKEAAKREADRKAQAELDRVERETQEANRRRNEMAMQELQSIHHQLMIADTGRAPYCKGGDLASIDYALKGTEEWNLTEERFGHLYQSAVKAKETVIATLQQKRVDFIKRQDDARAATERQKELDAQKEANDAQEEERRQTAAQETGRIAAARQQLERDQEAARKAAEPKQSKSEQKRLAAMKGYPTQAELLDGVAAYFKTDADTARGWLSFYDWKAADERKSA